MKKMKFFTEPAWLLGLVLLGIGTAMLERADFGMSMVVAPAYLLHLKLSETLPFFSFGMATYLFQAALIVLLTVILRRFRLIYLGSFLTAVVYGFILDGCVALIGCFPEPVLIGRLLFYTCGIPLCTLGIAMVLRSYFPPEAYELLVKEVTAKRGTDFGRGKLIYDLSSLALSVLLSFLFFGFGQFEGIHIGTLISAVVNGPFISMFGKMLNRLFNFSDALPLRTRLGG
jgi:uncharacterized membrane protein YczE